MKAILSTKSRNESNTSDLEDVDDHLCMHHTTDFKILPLVTLLIFLMMTGCSAAAPLDTTSKESVTLIIATPTAAIDTPGAAEISLEPTAVTASAVSYSEEVAVDLRLGYVERGLNCQFFTELMVVTLEQKQKMNILVAAFETENDLFDALTEQEIDLTFCFADPLDRSQIKPRLGHIRQIGSHYWQSDKVKMQIWANTASKADLRDEEGCVLSFLESLNLSEIKEIPTDAKAWYQTNPESVSQWLRCTPS